MKCQFQDLTIWILENEVEGGGGGKRGGGRGGRRKGGGGRGGGRRGGGGRGGRSLIHASNFPMTFFSHLPQN